VVKTLAQLAGGQREFLAGKLWEFYGTEKTVEMRPVDDAIVLNLGQ